MSIALRDALCELSGVRGYFARTCPNCCMDVQYKRQTNIVGGGGVEQGLTENGVQPERPGEAPSSGAPRLKVLETATIFRPEHLSAISISWGNGRVSHRADIRPEHRSEIARWLRRLALRIDGGN